MQGSRNWTSGNKKTEYDVSFVNDIKFRQNNSRRCVQENGGTKKVLRKLCCCEEINSYYFLFPNL